MIGSPYLTIEQMKGAILFLEGSSLRRLQLSRLDGGLGAHRHTHTLTFYAPCRGVSTEVGEEPYRIDRYLTQVQLAGYLKVISGFVFGRCARPWGSVKCRGGGLY
jgi:hypothetical protein